MTTATQEAPVGADQPRTPEFGSEVMDAVVGKISELVERKIRGALRKLKVGENNATPVVDESILDALATTSTTAMTLSSTSEEDEVTADSTDEKVLSADRLVGAVKVAKEPGNEEVTSTFADYIRGFRYHIADLLSGIDVDKAEEYFLSITITDGATTEENKPNRIEVGRKLSFFTEQKKEEPPKRTGKKK